MGAEIGILRAEARRVVAAGLAAVAAGEVTLRALAADPAAAPGPGGRRFILAAGRFAREMALAARGRLGPCETLIVTDPVAARPVEGARVLAAGWPDPDPAGLRAAEAAEAALARLGREDAVLVLLSAGAARMLPAPAGAATLADLCAVEGLMRRAGAEADEVLLVRQQLSRLEGGGLAARLAGARVTALAVADAEGGADPRRLAGGMFAPPLGSRVTARALLELYGLWERLPVRVLDRLATPMPAPADGARPRLRVIASNAVAVSAMAEGGVRAVMRPLQGAPEEIVHDLFALAAGVAPGSGRAFGLEPRPSDALLAGPENDAPVDGAGGAALTLRAPLVAGAAGPRHADLGLRFAMLARDRRLAGPWVLLLTASDGGGAAGLAPGVVVDSGTLAELAAAGIDAEEARRRGRAAEVLEWIGAVYRSGPTGTDVGDLAVFLRG
jgi:hydroxypyruvate reductase